MPKTYNDQNQLILSLVCIAAIVTSAIFYAKSGTSNGYLDDPVSSDTDHSLNEKNASKELEHNNITKQKLVLKPQPACPPLDKTLQLTALCEDLIFTKFSCLPEDVMNPAKHKIPQYYYQRSVRNNSNNETQNVIVNYIIAILLLTSLGAALLEFYRAKLSPTPENGKKGAKTPLNRKCSLADLTVLKHHRKELVRRESILEQHLEEEDGGSRQPHQGLKQSPLHRRSSFPANSFPADSVNGGLSMRKDSRKLSMTADSGRRISIVNDDMLRRDSIVGEDSSPERRIHHSRLVHRH